MMKISQRVFQSLTSCQNHWICDDWRGGDSRPACITLMTLGLARWHFGLNITNKVSVARARQWIIDPQYRMTCNVLTKLHSQVVQGGNLKLIRVIMAYENNPTVLCQHSYRWPPLTNQTLRTPKPGHRGHGGPTEVQLKNVEKRFKTLSCRVQKVTSVNLPYSWFTRTKYKTETTARVHIL